MEQGQEDREDIQDREVVLLRADHRFSKGVLTGVLATVCVMLLLAAVGVFWLHGRISPGGGASYEGVSANIVDSSVRNKVHELAALIKAYYYEDVTEEELTEGLYKGLFASLEDPYSAYYTQEEYEEMMISASAQYNGIGAVLQQDPDTMEVRIVKVYDGTPAQQAGLKAQDMVVMVEDIDARSMELSELVTHIRGKENSSVRLLITRDEKFKEREFFVKRAQVRSEERRVGKEC